MANYDNNSLFPYSSCYYRTCLQVEGIRINEAEIINCTTLHDNYYLILHIIISVEGVSY